MESVKLALSDIRANKKHYILFFIQILIAFYLISLCRAAFFQIKINLSLTSEPMYLTAIC